MDLKNLDKNKKYILSGATIRELAEAARTAQLLPGKGYELDIMPAKGTRLKLGAAGAADMLFTPGFWVSWAGPGKVRIQPSIVGGVAPDVSGTWSLGSGDVIALRVKMEPTVDDHDPSGAHDYQIVDGGGTIEAVTVRIYASMAAANSASQLAVINNGTGEVTQDGMYVLPLAQATSSATLVQVGYIGPIGIRMCASGAAIVGSPAIQLVAVDPDGKIVEPSLE